jgi:uncharacterized membrane protein YhaH (DUF805 family)|tara:strand:+ start:1239 stop:1583 length:345 start_codon:yes stop_codon:yes gene_type:complete
MEHFVSAVEKFADFHGRATRTAYWMFVLINIIIQAILTLLGFETIAAIISLLLIIPSISLGARRLHDTGRSGWWQLIYFLPLIGLIVMIVFLVQDSVDDNEYGPNPKAETSVVA